MEARVLWALVDGRPFHPERLSKMFQAAAKHAGLPRIRLHDLRHGYTTAGLLAGEDLKTMSERLGHANISITADTYQHVPRSVDQSAAERVAGLIFGQG